MDVNENIFLYRAVFVDEKLYYGTIEERTKIKTNYAFVCDTQLGICGDIKHIILAKQNIFLSLIISMHQTNQSEFLHTYII